MVRKASEFCLPWQGSRPSNNKQLTLPQLGHDWPYPGTPHHTRLQSSHSSSASFCSCSVWTEDLNIHMLRTLSWPGPSGTTSW